MTQCVYIVREKNREIEITSIILMYIESEIILRV